jgi:hypothetical protein
MANLLPFLSKKPFAHIPLDFIVLAAMWNFAQKNTAWNMYIYTNNKGSWCMKPGVFFFKFVSRGMSQIWLEVTQGKVEKMIRTLLCSRHLQELIV